MKTSLICLLGIAVVGCAPEPPPVVMPPPGDYDECLLTCFGNPGEKQYEACQDKCKSDWQHIDT